MQTVSSAYAQQHLSELLQAASQGERIIIEKRQRAIAELGPPTATTPPIPKFGTGKGTVKILDPHWADPLIDREVDALIEGRY